MPVLPLLIEKLCAERYLTRVASAWAIRAIGDEATLPPLLESWARTTNIGRHCGEGNAVHTVMEVFKAEFRRPPPDALDPDLLAFLNVKVCDAGAAGLTSEVDSRGRPFARYVISNAVATTYRLMCAGVPIELRSLRWEWEMMPPYKTHDVKVGRLILETLDLDPVPRATEMPVFVERFGSPPTAIAHVMTVEGNSGAGELWVKAGGAWILVSRLYGLIS